MTKKFLTPREASIVANKSEITIKRLIKKLYDNAKSNDIHDVLSMITKEKAPKGFFWKIEEGFLRESLGLQEKTSVKDTALQILQKQLEKKDEQISQLLDRQRESNILTKNLQDKVLALEPGEKKTGQSMVDQEETVPKKKGFWRRIFKKQL